MIDLSPALDELRTVFTNIVRQLPLIGVGIILSFVTWFVTKFSVRYARKLFGKKLHSELLRDVASRAVGVPIFLLGLYLVLKVSGLTRLAMTVLGGTGIVGLIIGFAFKDIAENFLASILISLQHPFAVGDLIEVDGFQGYVQRVNARSTLLMTLDGNHVQIPNATVYKSTITNYTANPFVRFSFGVGIGYDDSISQAQSTALQVLQNHPAIVAEPEPMVLVESLGSATVNLQIYFWVDAVKYSGLKVRSAIIRLTKRAFSEAGISMPDEAREVVFPQGVPVQVINQNTPNTDSQNMNRINNKKKANISESDLIAHESEGSLISDAAEIEKQARNARVLESGTNIL